ncbi:hypothetical protein S40285_00320 [Stachybotrys chlorohalonatus IBT 40285]|uniref:Nonsense-mediated mRNA decay factor n=1 Tax=Stachybotrys chlorohalonatus (strain IBT 40285) TaxID=1283841 RepID=A0A084QHL6_STAC4|nr:hypothetical protein S40285_00320 [Stachybotrys chlorohalonata IBT 40285]
MATSTSQAAPAAQSWHQAQKLRKHLTKQLEKLRADSGPKLDLAQLDAMDGVLEKLRLACVQTIFLDFEYAFAQEAERHLWQCHTSINSEYRSILGRLKNSPNAVEKRKIEKTYNNFLRIAQKFYRGYIQRLAARYDIPELKRVAQGIEVETIPNADTISPESQDLRRHVLHSCHSTLVRLGDLARYRIQARHKKSGYDTALTYYSLAHDLMPASGFAIHQMGIVNVDEGNHLDAVYHLYRAWVAANPHPMAINNLECEFKVLRVQSSARNLGQSTPRDVLSMWFVKLHANFYKGEVFQAHKELEGEVIHRLEMVARQPDATKTLLKMVLINISAYHVASLKLAKNPDSQASLFGQYSLALNARFIFTLCNVMSTELVEATSKEDLDGTAKAGSMQIVDALLPLLRTYCMWLATCRHALFGAADSAGTQASTMMQSLAQTFTLLCDETYKHENPASCPYLLAEDLEFRGARPLDEEQVPQPCRSYSQVDGSIKPYPPAPEQRLTPPRESLARILDVLRCAYFLAEDDSVPLVHRVQGGRLVFQYQQKHLNMVARSEAAPTNGPSMNAVEPAATRQQRVPVAVQESPEPADIPSLQGPIAVPDVEPRQLTEVEEAAEHTVFQMLAPFLRPPTSEPPRILSPAHISHGAQNVALRANSSSFSAEPSPTGSVEPGKFEPLPWNWVYTPTPHTAQEQTMAEGQEAFLTHASPGLQSAGINNARHSVDDPFVSPTRASYDAQAPQDVGLASRSPSSAVEEAHRNDLLQSFVNAGPSSRRSIFSTYGTAANASRKESEPSTFAHWRTPGLDNPLSSASEFSHPSSLYQGTPANGAGNRRGTAYELPANQAQLPGLHQGNSRSSQIDRVTLNYDAAVFDAAHYTGTRGPNSGPGR